MRSYTKEKVMKLKKIAAAILLWATAARRARSGASRT